MLIFLSFKIFYARSAQLKKCKRQTEVPRSCYVIISVKEEVLKRLLSFKLLTVE